jgi:hypothetical protein
MLLSEWNLSGAKKERFINFLSTETAVKMCNLYYEKALFSDLNAYAKCSIESSDGKLYKHIKVFYRSDSFFPLSTLETS